MSAKQKIVQGRGPFNINLGIFVSSFEVPSFNYAMTWISRPLFDLSFLSSPFAARNHGAPLRPPNSPPPRTAGKKVKRHRKNENKSTSWPAEYLWAITCEFHFHITDVFWRRSDFPALSETSDGSLIFWKQRSRTNQTINLAQFEGFKEVKKPIKIFHLISLPEIWI